MIWSRNLSATAEVSDCRGMAESDAVSRSISESAKCKASRRLRNDLRYLIYRMLYPISSSRLVVFRFFAAGKRPERITQGFESRCLPGDVHRHRRSAGRL